MNSRSLTKISLLVSLVAIFVVAFTAKTVFAQFSTASQDIELIVAPTYPLPNQNISITVSHFSINLDAAEITWFSGNKEISSGIGQKKISLTAPGLGKNVTVSVYIRSLNGESANAAVTVSPSEVDMIWEGNSYAHPFYRGKTLYPTFGSVNIIALPRIPNGRGGFFNEKELVYKWEVNGKVIGEKSGFAKNSITVNDMIFRTPISVKVIITSLNGSAFGQGTVAVPASIPRIFVYENNPLLGILFNKSIGVGITMDDTELNLEAFPFFITSVSRNSEEITYQWSLNGQNLESQSSGSLTLRKDSANDRGTANVGLRVNNAGRAYETPSFFTSVMFGKSEESNF
ncbi:MAG: hypothetical protein A3G59_01490 [Candidatus Taylorbacteria bacterium RIFCSPLOWO2_12_FULL_47_20]|uniref:Uncharacterized protein n=2 Tax=Candidatus Tayloriibacteriota TaxID=1817919 RepID=A0A1G2P8N3_9BACT|nr:MAG: hypothetical protein A3H68_01070 [Candidatus Taylorbacteria bacterium RIFCSPLOWO2_02_FULL_46_40]OHA43972.1 MAG: hypothetical protein A3G59_01490 [Candidatus Taylorbacteria bacterium RIFCSPLOWO2_12_FULL_47_20]